MKVTISVSGHVQGVGFRYLTKRVADKLTIYGTVKNQANGNVFIEAMGEADKVTQFIEEIKKSPAPLGQVNGIKLDQMATFPDYKDFSIVY